MHHSIRWSRGWEGGLVPMCQIKKMVASLVVCRGLKRWSLLTSEDGIILLSVQVQVLVCGLGVCVGEGGHCGVCVCVYLYTECKQGDWPPTGCRRRWWLALVKNCQLIFLWFSSCSDPAEFTLPFLSSSWVWSKTRRENKKSLLIVIFKGWKMVLYNIFSILFFLSNECALCFHSLSSSGPSREISISANCNIQQLRCLWLDPQETWMAATAAA